MNGYDHFLEVLSEGLKAFSKGMEILADQISEYAKAQSERTTTEQKEEEKDQSGSPMREETKTTPETGMETEQPATHSKEDMKTIPTEEPEKTLKKASGKAKAKPKVKPKTRPKTGNEKVYRLITQSENGVNIDALSQQTGFNRKQIYGIVNRLKKQNKIKSIKKGVYETV